MALTQNLTGYFQILSRRGMAQMILVNRRHTEDEARTHAQQLAQLVSPQVEIVIWDGNNGGEIAPFRGSTGSSPSARLARTARAPALSWRPSSGGATDAA